MLSAVVYLLAQWARKDMAQVQRVLDEKKRGEDAAAAAAGGGAGAAGGGGADLAERLSAVEATIQALLRSQPTSQKAAEGETPARLRTADAAQPPTAVSKPDDHPRRPPQ